MPKIKQVHDDLWTVYSHEELGPDSVEKLFCEPFEKLPPQPLDQDSMKLLMTLITTEMMSGKGIPEVEEVSKEIREIASKDFKSQVAKSRTKIFTYSINDNVAVFLSHISPNLGTLVLILTYIQYWIYRENSEIKEGSDKILKKDEEGKTIVDISILTEIFPYGFKSDKDMNEMWYNLKVEMNIDHPIDNMVDYPYYMQSIIIPR